MGRKRKRAPTKQSWASTSSRKQKKRRKTRGHALNQAKVSKEVDGSQVKLSNTTDSKMLELIAREKSSSSCNLTSTCTFLHDNSLKIWKFFGISAVISRFNSFASMFQCSTMECFRSIRNVFLLLNWFKQIFGCGLQTQGKVSYLCANQKIVITLIWLWHVSCINEMRDQTARRIFTIMKPRLAFPS